MDEPKIVTLRVTEQGAVRVNAAHVHREAAGIWWKLAAYNLKPEELRERLPDIEAALIAAWNALKEPT